MNPSIRAIRDLLIRSNWDDQLIKRHDSLLENSSLVVTSVEIPLKNALDIYTRRAKLNASTGKQIEGLDDLVSNLKMETGVRVGIHSIQAGKRWLFVFTSPSIDKLIGILAPRSDELTFSVDDPDRNPTKF